MRATRPVCETHSDEPTGARPWDGRLGVAMNRIRGKLLLLFLVVAAAAALMLPSGAAAGWTWDAAADGWTWDSWIDTSDGPGPPFRP
jgi:hypothetical protein